LANIGKMRRPTYKNTLSAQRSCILDTVTGQGKMVLVREKSGKSQGILIAHLCGNPEKNTFKVGAYFGQSLFRQLNCNS